MALIDGIDHVVIAVRDLDQSHRRFVQLGFTLTPRGDHTQLETANHTIMFPDMTYFELLTVTREGLKNAYYADFLHRREGIAGVALKSRDARAVHEAMNGDPFRASEAIDFARAVDMPEGHRDAAFTVTQFDAASTPGTRCFVCQHHTPDYVWRKDMLAHANGTIGLRAVMIVVEEVVAATQRYEMLFGTKARRIGEVAEVPTGTCSVIITTPENFEYQHGQPVPRGASSPFAAAIWFKVVDRRATEALLRTHRIPTTMSNTGAIVVPAHDAHGTTLMFS